MKLRELRLSDLQLRSCTRWENPDGVKVLQVPHVLPWFRSIPANATQNGIEMATHAEFPFLVKAIGYTGVTPGTLIRLQWPDGRYLSNPGVDMFSFCRTGRDGRLLDPHKRLPPAQKLRFDVDNSAVGSQSVIELFLEGVLEVPLMAGGWND